MGHKVLQFKFQLQSLSGFHVADFAEEKGAFELPGA